MNGIQRFTKKLPSVQGVGAGQTATLNIPLGQEYEELIIEIKNNGTPAGVDKLKEILTEIRLIVNGTVIKRISGGKLLHINNRYDIKRSQGILRIPFMRHYMHTKFERELTALGTANLQTVTLEFDIASTAVNPAIEVWAKTRGIANPIGAHIKWIPYTVSSVSAGKFEKADFVKVKGEATLGFYIFSDKITSAKIIADGIEIYNYTKALSDLTNKSAGRVVSDDVFDVDLLEKNQIEDALPIVNTQDFRLEMEASDAISNLTILQEVLVSPAQQKK